MGGRGGAETDGAFETGVVSIGVFPSGGPPVPNTPGFMSATRGSKATWSLTGKTAFRFGYRSSRSGISGIRATDGAEGGLSPTGSVVT